MSCAEALDDQGYQVMTAPRPVCVELELTRTQARPHGGPRCVSLPGVGVAGACPHARAV